MSKVSKGGSLTDQRVHFLLAVWLRGTWGEPRSVGFASADASGRARVG